jgi:hypothetical protein
VAKTVDPFAKAIHDLAVAAGAKCGARSDHGARHAADASVKRSRRRNLTVSEAAAMGGRPRGNLTLAEAERMSRGA